MEETVAYARKLAQRIGDELKYPVYCYESAAFSTERKNLARIRAGEYEGLPEKLADPDWKPDFGPPDFNLVTGATAVGARDFLVAYNINLNTTSTRRANAIAFDVREIGRAKRMGDPLTCEIVRDEQGAPVMIPGSLKEVKAIGWFIEEYGIAQISMNLTNISVTPVHVAFDEVFKRAEARGVRVSGSELVGLIPLKALLDAGRYFLRKQQRSVGVSDRELIKIAVKSMGLDDLHPFKPEEKVIEYRIREERSDLLSAMSVRDFMEETASESPTPGGGSISACIGSLGTALGTMVANLSSHKRGWDDRWEEFSEWADRGKAIQEELLAFVDEDSLAFNRIMEAFAMPKNSEDERHQRKAAIEEATRDAILVPYRVMQKAASALEILKAMAELGNPNSVSDVGVGALALRSAVMGAFLNIKINAVNLDDKPFVEKILEECRELEASVCTKEAEILTIVESRI
jgi:glutamate formiminotransferase/formiminotetrahydrofolate cyclodeaminase